MKAKKTVAVAPKATPKKGGPYEVQEHGMGFAVVRAEDGIVVTVHADGEAAERHAAALRRRLP